MAKGKYEKSLTDKRLMFEQTVELLGLTKSFVQPDLKRVERKIENRKNGSLFLVS